jgi:4-hydroxy-tetrahydrodipicolinate reductase
MNIAIIGYGKMGHAIERIALSRGHNIVAVIDADNAADIATPQFRSADAAIEFTTPATAEAMCRAAIAQGVPVVSGTTGWTAALPAVGSAAEAAGTALLWSSNYSLGVALFRLINRYAAALMAPFSQYTPHLTEVHHTHKLDHPSGTAITLADELSAACPRIDGWSEEPADGSATLRVDHIRRAEVPGIHTIDWDSPVDHITLEHNAASRDGFALGAVMAAEWIAGRTGLFSIDDMMRSILPEHLLNITDTNTTR